MASYRGRIVGKERDTLINGLLDHCSCCCLITHPGSANGSFLRVSCSVEPGGTSVGFLTVLRYSPLDSMHGFVASYPGCSEITGALGCGDPPNIVTFYYKYKKSGSLIQPILSENLVLRYFSASLIFA